MTFNKNRLSTFLYLFFIFTGCTVKYPEIKWNYSEIEVIGTQPQKVSRIDFDVYLDCTSSMKGFAVGKNSIYSQFLDQLEASALSAWKESSPKYFKFGSNIKQIDRDVFLQAKDNLSFYRDLEVGDITQIDSVIKRTNPDRLSVVITDLFNNEADVNIMVERIKSKCFANGVMVGIIGVKSDFSGKVFDVPAYPKGYFLDSKERPFYAIVFGNPYNMEYLFEALKVNPFVQESQFMIFSNYIVKSDSISLIKTRDSKFINKKAPRQPKKNSFDFSMKQEGKEAKFDIILNINRNTRCPDFSEKNIVVGAYKKSITDPKGVRFDSISTNDISIENLQRTGNKLTATLLLKNEDDVGNYSYEIYLKTNPLNGLKVPQWIIDFSTDNPIEKTPSASKTYNLEKFVSRLLVANSSMVPTYLAKFHINIFKR